MESYLYLLVASALAVLLFFLFRTKTPSGVGAKPTPPPDDGKVAKPVAGPAEAPAEPVDGRAAAPAPLLAGEPQGEAQPAAAPGQSAPPAPSARRMITQRPPSDLSTLRRGLSRSRQESGFFGRLKALLGSRGELDEALVQQVEEVLLSSDVGAPTTAKLLAKLRESLSNGEAKDARSVWAILREQARAMLSVDGDGGSLNLTHKPTVMLFVGVNGAGKTTTIGKLASRLSGEGRTCVLVAGDTFRAAAVQQLMIWGKRVGCEVIVGKDGADPASVLFDATRRAKELGADVVLADTAGRLHTKSNLMQEMQKIARSAGKALDGSPHEILLVIDSTNGQNALAQAREFQQSLSLSGIVLTKLDGTAKGGVVLGIADALSVPVRFVGMGERPEDLHPFEATRFVDALLGDETTAVE